MYTNSCVYYDINGGILVEVTISHDNVANCQYHLYMRGSASYQVLAEYQKDGNSFIGSIQMYMAYDYKAMYLHAVNA